MKINPRVKKAVLFCAPIVVPFILAAYVLILTLIYQLLSGVMNNVLAAVVCFFIGFAGVMSPLAAMDIMHSMEKNS
jgi:hypothetical protein